MRPDTRVGMTFGHEFVGVVENTASVRWFPGCSPMRLAAGLFALALVLLAVLVAVCPETALRPEPTTATGRGPAPRAPLFAATSAGVASFAVYRVFTSLVPGFLASTLHQSSYELAGTVAFASWGWPDRRVTLDDVAIASMSGTNVAQNIADFRLSGVTIAGQPVLGHEPGL
jgi:hypothetical protein